MHKLHHSLSQLNWSASPKAHVLEQFSNLGPRMLVLIIPGVQPEVILMYMLYNTAVSYINHSNITLNTRWFNTFLYTPDHHRFHHSQVVREANSNYSGPTLIWDVIFGTLYLPSTEGPQILGLGQGEDVTEWQHQHSIWKAYWLQCLAPIKYWLGIAATTTETTLTKRKVARSSSSLRGSASRVHE